MNVESIGHIFLTVKNIEATCAFYPQVLSMGLTPFGVGGKAPLFGTQKISLNEHENTFEPKAKVPKPGVADLCFVTPVLITQVLDQSPVYDN